MMLAPKGFQHTLMIRINLRNAHIINKSYLVHRQTHFLMRFPWTIYDLRSKRALRGKAEQKQRNVMKLCAEEDEQRDGAAPQGKNCRRRKAIWPKAQLLPRRGENSWDEFETRVVMRL